MRMNEKKTFLRWQQAKKKTQKRRKWLFSCWQQTDFSSSTFSSSSRIFFVVGSHAAKVFLWSAFFLSRASSLCQPETFNANHSPLAFLSLCPSRVRKLKTTDKGIISASFFLTFILRSVAEGQTDKRKKFAREKIANSLLRFNSTG